MKEKTRILIAVLLLGILVSAGTVGLWLRETGRASRGEALANEALDNGDWEQAQKLAEQAGADDLRAEAIYQSAEQLLENGDYAGAEQAFASLGAYRDAAARIQACRYAAAEALEREGDDRAAADAFFALVPYADALDRYRACCYREAERLLSEGIRTRHLRHLKR